MTVIQFDGDTNFAAFLVGTGDLPGATGDFHVSHAVGSRHVGLVGLNGVIENDESFLFETNHDLSVVNAVNSRSTMINISIGTTQTFFQVIRKVFEGKNDLYFIVGQRTSHIIDSVKRIVGKLKPKKDTKDTTWNEKTKQKSSQSVTTQHKHC